jgi:hypothetical protein
LHDVEHRVANLQKVGNPYILPVFPATASVIPKHIHMSTLPPIHRKYKKLLTQNPTKKQLWEIIHDFLHYYSAEGIKEELWMLTIGTLSSDHMEEVEKGISRHNRIFFYEHSSLFIDAIDQLYNKQKGKKAKPEIKQS